jgi:hypothetical protein
VSHFICDNKNIVFLNFFRRLETGAGRKDRHEDTVQALEVIFNKTRRRKIRQAKTDKKRRNQGYGPYSI